MGPRSHHRLISSVNAVNAVIGSTATSTSDATDLSVTGALPFHVALERGELLGPVRLKLIEPGLELDQALGTETKDPQPGILRAPLVRDDPGVKQHPQVAAHGGGGGAGRPSPPARGPGSG